MSEPSDTISRADVTSPTDVDTAAPDREAHAEITDELLVEEISIDGMCGVY